MLDKYAGSDEEGAEEAGRSDEYHKLPWELMTVACQLKVTVR